MCFTGLLVPASNPEQLSDGLLPHFFVDWCDAVSGAEMWARYSITAPLVIVGAIKSGKSAILKNLIPAAVAKMQTAQKYVPLVVDWSVLKQDMSFRTVLDKVQRQLSIAMAFREGLGAFFRNVDVICADGGYRALHLWDEAHFLFKFDSKHDYPMFSELKRMLYSDAADRRSAFVLTGTASQMVLKVIADQPPNGTCTWMHSKYLVIRTPTSHDPPDQLLRVALATEHALIEYWKLHKMDPQPFNAKQLQDLFGDDVVTPAICC